MSSDHRSSQVRAVEPITPRMTTQRVSQDVGCAFPLDGREQAAFVIHQSNQTGGTNHLATLPVEVLGQDRTR